MKSKNLKYTPEQQLVCNFVGADLFADSGVIVDSFVLDHINMGNPDHNTLGVFVEESSEENRKDLERLLFQEKVNYYYEPKLSYYLLSYNDICRFANTDKMLKLDELKKHLEKAPNFKGLDFDVPYLEYKRIIKVDEDEEEFKTADFIHGIFSHKNNRLFWVKIKNNYLHSIEVEE